MFKGIPWDVWRAVTIAAVAALAMIFEPAPAIFIAFYFCLVRVLKLTESWANQDLFAPSFGPVPILSRLGGTPERFGGFHWNPEAGHEDYDFLHRGFCAAGSFGSGARQVDAQPKPNNHRSQTGSVAAQRRAARYHPGGARH
jgi:hypothetical protein